MFICPSVRPSAPPFQRLTKLSSDHLSSFYAKLSPNSALQRGCGLSLQKQPVFFFFPSQKYYAIISSCLYPKLSFWAPLVFVSSCAILFSWKKVKNNNTLDPLLVLYNKCVCHYLDLIVLLSIGVQTWPKSWLVAYRCKVLEPTPYSNGSQSEPVAVYKYRLIGKSPDFWTTSF